MALTAEEENVAKEYIRAALQRKAGDEESSDTSLGTMYSLAKTADRFTPQLIQRFHAPENRAKMEELQEIVEGELAG
jgi:hypothetical protein